MSSSSPPHSHSGFITHTRDDRQVVGNGAHRRHAAPVVNISGQARVQLGDTYIQSGPDHLQQLIASLQYPEIVQRYESIEENHGTTCHWILFPPEEQQMPWDSFVKWLQDDQPLYWISGKPGSGKSTLMKYLVENISDLDIYQHRSPVVLSCWFWEAGSPLQHTLLGALRSLLWQLLKHRLPTDASRSVIEAIATTNLSWTKTRLFLSVKSVLRTYLDTGQPVLIFLDGLDECISEGPALVRLIFDIVEQCPGLKLCVSSRPEPLYSDAFRSVQKLQLQDLNAGDIDEYMDQRFFEDVRVQRLADSFEQYSVVQFRRTMHSKAEGVFLWATLAVESLLRGISNRDSWQILMRRLEQLPSEMEDLYTSMLARLGSDTLLYAERAATYFALASCHGWSLLEFYLATDDDLRERLLAYEDAPTVQNLLGAVQWKEFAKRVSSQTAGLLVVTDTGTVYFRFTEEGDPTHYPRRMTVQFVHRTGLTYVTDTLVGAGLLEPSRLSEVDVRIICNEVHILVNMLLPPLVSGVRDMWLDEEDMCMQHGEPESSLLQPVHHIYNCLLKYDLIELDMCRASTELNFVVSQRIPFPSTIAGRLDFLRIYIHFGWLRTFETALWTDAVPLDREYLSLLLLAWFEHLPWNTRAEDLVECQNTFQRLLDLGADLGCIIDDGSGRLTRIVWRMIAMYKSAKHACIKNDLMSHFRLVNLQDSLRSSIGACVRDYYASRPYNGWAESCMVKLATVKLPNDGDYFALPVQRIYVVHERPAKPHQPMYLGQGAKLYLVSQQDSDEILAQSYDTVSIVLRDFSDHSCGIKCSPGTLEKILKRSPVAPTCMEALVHMGHTAEAVHRYVERQLYLVEALQDWPVQNNRHLRDWKRWMLGVDVDLKAQPFCSLTLPVGDSCESPAIEQWHRSLNLVHQRQNPLLLLRGT